MYNWLEYLAGLGIAEAILFLWGEHFKTNPLFVQVAKLILVRGSEQQSWFPTINHKLPIIEVEISSSEFLSWSITRRISLRSINERLGVFQAFLGWKRGKGSGG